MATKNWRFSWTGGGQIDTYGPTFTDLQNSYKISRGAMPSALPDAYAYKQTYEPKTLTWEKVMQETLNELWAIPMFKNVSFDNNETGATYTIHIIQRTKAPVTTVGNGEVLYLVTFKIRVIS